MHFSSLESNLQVKNFIDLQLPFLFSLNKTANDIKAFETELKTFLDRPYHVKLGPMKNISLLHHSKSDLWIKLFVRKYFTFFCNPSKSRKEIDVFEENLRRYLNFSSEGHNTLLNERIIEQWKKDKTKCRNNVKRRKTAKHRYSEFERIRNVITEWNANGTEQNVMEKQINCQSEQDAILNQNGNQMDFTSEYGIENGETVNTNQI